MTSAPLRVADTHRPYSWLPALVLVMVAVALAIAAMALHVLEARLVETTGESLRVAAAGISDQVDRLVFERSADVELMARALSDQAWRLEDVHQYLRWMKTQYPVYLWLGVVDERGQLVASTEPGMVGREYAQSDWFRAARERREPAVGDVDPYDSVGGAEAIAFSAPILAPTGEFCGAVAAQVGLAALEEIAAKTMMALQVGDGGLGPIEYQFLNARGEAFLDSDLSHKGWVNLRQLGLPSVRLSESGRSGSVEEEHLRRRVPVVTGYARTRGNNKDRGGPQWTVLLRVDRDRILGPIRGLLWTLGGAGLAVWLPMVGLLLWATRRLRTEYEQARRESEWARAAETALLQSQERNRVIVDTALDAVITTDAGGVITDWNAQASHLFGWTREEAVGRRLSATIFPERERAAHEQGLEQFLSTGESRFLNRRVEVTACHRDGHEFPVELAIASARVGDATIFSAFVRDITARKRAECRLASQYAVTRVLSECRALTDAAPKILQALCESLEWEVGVLWQVDRSADELRCLDLWVSPASPADEFVTATVLHTFKRGVGLPGRVWAAGDAAWIADVLADANFPRALSARAVGLHGAFGFPVRVGGDVEAVVELYSRQVREPDEELLKMAADLGLKIGQFVERSRTQEALRQAEAQLRQSQKMEAIGRLAGGVAHDFNNLLTVIRGYSDLVLARLHPTEPLRKDIEEVKKAADRAASLTAQLLAFSRRQFVAPKLVDLNVVVSGMETMLRRLIGEDLIQLCTVLDPQAGLVKADPGQIEQVVMNLAVNAHDAMPTGGTLTIETRGVQIAESPGRNAQPVDPGSYVMLAVRDTGCGMDEETQSHLFEPFFTTKEKGKGTGLGLSTVYGIVKQCGGHITVESKPSHGTAFTILFPRADETAETTEPGVMASGESRGKETVLLVEDEPGVRGLVHNTLKLHGYTVLEARHGIEALLTGAQHMGPIHLLLTDVVMPQMSGPEVAERLAAVRPGLKVLYMSGYPDHPIFSRTGVTAHAAFLPKPFTPNALARKVREVLDGAA
ncbi:MAG TPA: PAS domain S-box protein [Nitrospiraceae bacterium]|jgi:PAS domain S-box-containing protein|nr:PAS domain S-box protein [Nitrospiraceae bacterium]